MMLSVKRKQEQEEARLRKEMEAQEKREAEKLKEEEKQRKKEEEKARRQMILERYKIKKAMEEAEKEVVLPFYLRVVEYLFTCRKQFPVSHNGSSSIYYAAARQNLSCDVRFL